MERDDLIKDHEYAVAAYHDEEHGKQVRKKVWKVTAILSILTIVEVIMGAFIARADTMTWQAVKIAFIVMTLFKAGYIVLSFMHLGDEKKSLKNIVIIPYVFLIIYAILLIITSEANEVHDYMDQLYMTKDIL